jgi:CRISPR/Cas system-associated exonuclease Cas4 (RecB family)
MPEKINDLPTEVQENIESLLNERTFSFSRLSLIENCLYAYFLKYVEQISVDDEKDYLMLGKAVHKAIEEKLKGLDDKQALIAGWKEVDYHPFNLEEYEWLFRQSKVIRGEALGEYAQTEIHFKIPLTDKPFTPYLQGYIDYLRVVYGSYDFTDWKTNRKMYEPSETYQLALYAVAVNVLYGVTRVTGTLHFLRFYKSARKTHTFTEIDMIKAKTWASDLAFDTLQRLSDLKDGLKTVEEAFPPKLNDKCSYCPFAHICVSKYPNAVKQTA